MESWFLESGAGQSLRVISAGSHVETAIDSGMSRTEVQAFHKVCLALFSRENMTSAVEVLREGVFSL